MRAGRKPREPKESIEERLLAAFREAHWTVERASASDSIAGPAAILRRGPHAYALECRTWRGQPWKAVLRGLFADAAIHARAAAAACGLNPLVVVAAGKISDSMAAELASYQAALAPDVAWGLVDRHGRFELHGSGLEEVAAVGAPSQQSTPGRLGRQERRELPNPFSDLGQWALKILLATEIAPHLLSAPRTYKESATISPVRNVRDLARRANISEPRASDVVAALQRQGFLERRQGQIALVRRPALFEAWRAAQAEPAEEFGARFDLPAKDATDRLQNQLRSWIQQAERSRAGGPRASLGLFTAGSMLDLGVVRGAPVHLLAEDTSRSFLEQLGLHRVDERERPDVFVRRPRFPECAFRGRVLKNGVPVADALQVWLDVSHHPARGREQADEILSHLGLLEESG